MAVFLSLWLSISIFSLSQLDSGKEYCYTPPTQPPIHPPYEQACFMRKNNLLAKEEGPAASLDQALSTMQLSACEEGDQQPSTSNDQGGSHGTSATNVSNLTEKWWCWGKKRDLSWVMCNYWNAQPLIHGSKCLRFKSLKCFKVFYHNDLLLSVK